MPRPASLNVQVLDPTHPDFPIQPIDPVGESSIHPPVLIGRAQYSADGGFEFIVKGPVDRVVGIYRSTDLVNWERLGSVPNPTGGLLINDTEPSEVRKRFYRAVLQGSE
jgi:hypothetical protein